jgi:hypothetical protein
MPILKKEIFSFPNWHFSSNVPFESWLIIDANFLDSCLEQAWNITR